MWEIAYTLDIAVNINGEKIAYLSKGKLDRPDHIPYRIGQSKDKEFTMVVWAKPIFPQKFVRGLGQHCIEQMLLECTNLAVVYPPALRRMWQLWR